MDLSDGSDVEADVDLDQNVEDALLGSDEEDAGVHYSHLENSEYEQEYQDEDGHIVHGEDGDVLELELNDDYGLEFGDDLGAHRNGNRVAPVQIRASAMSTQDYSSFPSSSNFPHNAEEQEEYHDDGEDNYGASSLADIEDEDDDEDERNTRSRFLSERNPSSSTGTSSFAIQTLGVPGQKNWTPPNSAQQHRGQRPRFPPHHRQPLIGDMPRQGFYHHNMNRPQRGPRFHGPGPQVVQFQGRIFTDFNQPMMRPQNPNGPHPNGVRPNGIPPPPHCAGPGNRPPMQGPQNPQSQMNPRFHQNHPRFQNRNPSHPRMRLRGPGPPGNPQWRHQQRPPFQGMRMNQPPQQHPQNQFMDGPPRPQMFQPPMMDQQGHNPEMGFKQMNPGHPMSHHPYPSGNNLDQQRLQEFQADIHPPPNYPQQNSFYPPQHQQQPGFGMEQRLQPPLNRPPQQGYWPNQGPEPHINVNWVRPNPQQQPAGFPQPPFPQQQTMMMVAPQQFLQQPAAQHLAMEQQYAQQERQKSAAEVSYEESVRSFLDQHQRPHPRDSQRRSPSHSYSRDSEYEYDDRPSTSSRQDRYPSKRKYDDEESRSSGSPEKTQRLHGRLGPHPGTSQPPPRDEKTEQLQKIREETTKSMGLDAEYIKKLDEQKKLREEILRKKAEARKKLVGPGAPENLPTTSTSVVHQQQPQQIIVNNSSGRPSIYLNPKAFKGDLSALTLRKNNINGSNNNGPKQNVNVRSKNVSASLANVSPPKSSVLTAKSEKSIKPKGKTILRIVKDKHGNVISRSKVFVVPKLQQDDTP